MEIALALSQTGDSSSVAIFFPEQNKSLHVLLNGANLAICCGAQPPQVPET
jgi:hypothetical protein